MGVGKSLFVTNLGWCLATGRPFLGMEVARPYRVVYAQAEMNEWDVEERLRKQGEVITGGTDWSDVPYYYFSRKPWRWSPDIVELTEVMDEVGCEVLILDPLSRIKPSEVSENDNDKMGYFLNETLNGLIVNEALKALVIVHHFGKPSGEQPRDPLDLLRGASALRDWMENFIWVGGKRHAPDAKLVFDKVRGFAPRDNLLVQRRGLVFQMSGDMREPVLAVLADGAGHSKGEMNEVCGGDVSEALKGLVEEGLVERGSKGWRLR